MPLIQTGPRTVARYVAVAAAAFFLGSATIVAAAPAMGPIFRLQDATEPANIAHVDAAGNVAVTVSGGKIDTSVTNTDFPDAGAHSRLDTGNGSLAAIDADLDTGNGSLASIDADLDTTNSRLSSIKSKTDNLQFDASNNLKVSVANPPAAAPDPDSVRDVFQRSVVITVVDGACCLAAGQFTVPAGKRLVIETVSVNERNAGQRLVSASIFTRAASNTGLFHHIVLHDNGDWYFVGADQVRLYSDSVVSFQVSFDGSSGDRNVAFHLTGYLVPLP